MTEFVSQFPAMDNALHAGMKTTIGPASFYLYKQNQYDPKAFAKAGRKKKVCNYQLSFLGGPLLMNLTMSSGFQWTSRTPCT